jgi:hypothetical protein
VVSWLSLTKLHTYSTKVCQTKTHTRTPLKHPPRTESESATKPHLQINFFCKTIYFFRTKIDLETLLDILTTHGGSFQKFESESRSGISSNTCEAVFRKIKPTVGL